MREGRKEGGGAREVGEGEDGSEGAEPVVREVQVD